MARRSLEPGPSARMTADVFLGLARAYFDDILPEDSIYAGQNRQDSRDIFRAAAGAVARRLPHASGANAARPYLTMNPSEGS
jgi:hypothetical protein